MGGKHNGPPNPFQPPPGGGSWMGGMAGALPPWNDLSNALGQQQQQTTNYTQMLGAQQQMIQTQAMANRMAGMSEPPWGAEQLRNANQLMSAATPKGKAKAPFCRDCGHKIAHLIEYEKCSECGGWEVEFKDAESMGNDGRSTKSDSDARVESGEGDQNAVDHQDRREEPAARGTRDLSVRVQESGRRPPRDDP